MESKKNNHPLIISAETLKSLLDSAELIEEKDTLISGPLRLFKYDRLFIIQETSSKNEIIIRRFSDSHLARMLINERIEIYEKMWNGCGCKVNYYK